MKKRYVKLAFVSLLVLGVSWFGWQRWQTMQRYVSTDNAQISGTIIPVRARLSGVLVDVPVSDNLRLEKGSVLYRIRDDEYRLRLHQAEATYQGLLIASGQTELPGLLDSQLRGARARAEAARAMSAQLQANLAQARNDYQRSRRLHDQGVVSTQTLEQAKARFDTASHQFDGARKEEDVAAQGPLVQQAQLHIEQSRIDSAKAAVELGRLTLQDTIQVAPAAGVIADKQAQSGQFVVAGQRLLSLVLTDSLWVTANLKETQVGRVRIGQPARVTIDAFPEVTLQGVVQSLVPATGASFSLLPQENTSASFTKVVQRIQAKISLIDVPPRYRDVLSQGMSAEVEIDTRVEVVDRS